MRFALISVTLLLCMPAPVQAQFGLGGRLGKVRTDVEAGTPSERFTGGHIRARVSPRTTVEVGLDLRTTTSETLTDRVREYPIQASLLLFPVRRAIAPYVLGGAGWYTRRLETLADDEWVAAGDSTRRFGWHGGFGTELGLGRHAAAHVDYRYTFLRYRDEDGDAESSGVFSRFLPSYEGSMWMAGLTFYF